MQAAPAPDRTRAPGWMPAASWLKPAQALPQSFGRYVALAITYLVVEFAFNARLLDVAGSLATEREIDGLEFWGRIISGAGCSLLCWKLLASRRNPPRYAFGALAALAAVLVPAVYVAQDRLIEWAVDSSSGATRQAATYATLLRAGALHDTAALAGLDLSAEQRASAAGKTLYAVLPMALLAAPQLNERVGAALDVLVRRSVEQGMGAAAGFHNGFYVPVANRLIQAYNGEYRRLHDPASRGADVDAATARAWRDFRAGLTPGQVAALRLRHLAGPQRELVDGLRAQGIDVRDDFHFEDERAFRAAAARKFASDPQRVERAMTHAFGPGHGIRRGMPIDEFARTPGVQRVFAKAWREQFGRELPAAGPIGLDWDAEQTRKRLYPAAVGAKAAPLVAQLRRDAASFEAGGGNATRGRQAMRAAIVPPVALFFSLLFGLLNLYGLITMRLRLEGATRVAAPAMLAALLALPFALRNPVSESALFQGLAQASADRFAGPMEQALVWVVNAQPLLYPVADAARRGLLLDFQFGPLGPVRSGGGTARGGKDS